MSESTRESSAEDVPEHAAPPPPKPRRRKWFRRCGDREARIWMCKQNQEALNIRLNIEMEFCQQ